MNKTVKECLRKVSNAQEKRWSERDEAAKKRRKWEVYSNQSTARGTVAWYREDPDSHLIGDRSGWASTWQHGPLCESRTVRGHPPGSASWDQDSARKPQPPHWLRHSAAATLTPPPTQQQQRPSASGEPKQSPFWRPFEKGNSMWCLMAAMTEGCRWLCMRWLSWISGNATGTNNSGLLSSKEEKGIASQGLKELQQTTCHTTITRPTRILEHVCTRQQTLDQCPDRFI